MTTYREAIYMCLDLLKGTSDDFTYTEEHIAYLIDKFRALLLKQRYGNDPKKHVPYSNYQTLEVEFNPTEPKNMLKSTNQIPYMLQLGIPRIVLDNEDYYNYRFELTSRERLPFVGNNKFTSMIGYCAISETNNLLMKNKDSYWTNLTVEPPVLSYIGPKKLKLVGIFENPREVNDETSFGEDSTNINELDRNIPIEESLITTLIELVVKELAGSVYSSEDDVNNAKDDNADMQAFIARNMKSKLAKQLQ